MANVLMGIVCIDLLLLRLEFSESLFLLTRHQMKVTAHSCAQDRQQVQTGRKIKVTGECAKVDTYGFART
jgi:hypothetical protein